MTRRIVMVLESMALGGLQKVVLDHSNYLVSQDFDVQIVSLRKGGEFSSSINPNIDYVELNGARLRDAISQPRGQIWHGENVSYIFHQPQVFLVLLLWLVRFSPGALFRRIFIMLHSDYRTWQLPNITGYLQLFFSFILSRGVFVPCNAAIDRIRNSFPFSLSGKFIFLPNSVNLPARQASAKEKKSSIRLVFVGRLTPIKNLPFLFSALSCLKNENWTLDIYGDGEQRESLEKRAINLGFEKRVFFRGTNLNLDEVYGDKDALILPSESEGFGNCIVEALAYGVLPIVSNSSLGPLEIIGEGEFGLVYEASDLESLTNCIFQFLNRSLTFEEPRLMERANAYSAEKVLPMLGNQLRKSY